MRFSGVAIVSLALLSACAEEPSTDRDLALALAAERSQNHPEVLRQQAERIVGKPFTIGNKVELLRNGTATFNAMKAAISSARQRIDIESYIFDGDEGNAFADLLLQKSMAGVNVNLIYDAWGSRDTPKKLFDRMKNGGVHTVAFRPLNTRSLVDFSINSRDHRKLLLVDNRITIVGGINIASDYRRAPLRHELPVTDDVDEDGMRDTDIRIEGPATAQFEDMFLQTWKSETSDPIANPPPSPLAGPGDTLALALAGAPDNHYSDLYRSLIVAIALAQSSIHLTQSYFIPTPSVQQALQNAARRGIDVKLVVPGVVDEPMAFLAGRAYYGELMKAGVQIYERQGVILHAKTIVIDGIWSTVGSSNLDWRSVIFNNEADAVIISRNFGSQMEQMFKDDLAASKKINLQEWKGQPWNNIFNEIARFMAVLL